MLGEIELLRTLATELKTFGYIPQVGNRFVFAEGDIPVMLVAHCDTVHFKAPEMIVYDHIKEVAWSPNGLGADDRNGVLGIMKLIESGKRPYVLFTGGEESGGIGATNFGRSGIKLDEVKYMIEIDRCGDHDAVFYECGNQDFVSYIEQMTFFTENMGSFSDISTIMDDFDIAGVNLSSGYYNEHTNREYANFKELKGTLAQIEILLNDADNVETFSADVWSGAYYNYGTSGFHNGGDSYSSRDEFTKRESAYTDTRSIDLAIRDVKYGCAFCKNCPLMVKDAIPCGHSTDCGILFDTFFPTKRYDEYGAYIDSTATTVVDRAFIGKENAESVDELISLYYEEDQRKKKDINEGEVVMCIKKGYEWSALEVGTAYEVLETTPKMIKVETKQGTYLYYHKDNFIKTNMEVA